MGFAINIEIFGEIIEDFLVRELDNIEVAGSVTAKKEEDINYIKIDLSSINDWDQNSEELVQKISTYLSALFKAKSLDIYYMIEFKNLVIEIKAENTDNNISKNVVLFRTQDYRIEDEIESKSGITLWFKRNWIIILNIGTIGLLLVLSILLLNEHPDRKTAFIEGINRINIFAGIMASFVLAFVISKTLSLRQEKLSRTKTIRGLCYKLTCFRKICYHLRKDHNFWHNSASYSYAKSISESITHNDARYPDYDNEVKYAQYKALIITHKYDTSEVMFYLQLFMFAGKEFENDANLAWGDYPPFIIYSNDEIFNFFSFLDTNEFWTCIDHNKTVFSYSHNRFHIDPIEKAASNYKLKGLKKVAFSEDLLLKIAEDVQQSVIPDLYHLTKLNEARLPPIINYLVVMTTLLMFFSIVYPFIANILFNSFIVKNLNGLIILGLIFDVLLRLQSFLNKENSLDRPSDYR